MCLVCKPEIYMYKKLIVGNTKNLFWSLRKQHEYIQILSLRVLNMLFRKRSSRYKVECFFSFSCVQVHYIQMRRTPADKKFKVYSHFYMCPFHCVYIHQLHVSLVWLSCALCLLEHRGPYSLSLIKWKMLKDLSRKKMSSSMEQTSLLNGSKFSTNTIHVPKTTTMGFLMNMYLNAFCN